MEPIDITYQVKLGSDRIEEFDFSLDAETFELPLPDIENPPKWTELEWKQCPNCPLDKEEHSHCPLALHMHDIVERLHDTKSIDEVEVEVVTEERRVIQTTAIQRVVACLFGLLFPVSGCPVTAHMRPLSRFHTPLSSEEEMVFRVSGMYLLAQYFLNNTGKTGQFDFDGLLKIYEDLHILNVSIAKRLQSATKSDSVKNAVTLLDMYSTLIPMLVEDQLVEMRSFFKAYFPEGEDFAVTSNLLEKAKSFSLELMPIEGEVPDDTPGWMKEIQEEEEVPGGSEEASPDGEVAVPEEIVEKEDPLAARTFSFDLEPLDGGAPADEDEGKASFSVPDD